MQNNIRRSTVPKLRDGTGRGGATIVPKPAVTSCQGAQGAARRRGVRGAGADTPEPIAESCRQNGDRMRGTFWQAYDVAELPTGQGRIRSTVMSVQNLEHCRMMLASSNEI